MKKATKDYLSALPVLRRRRLEGLRTAFLRSAAGVQESMKYKMPTFEIGPNQVAIGNQKNYLSVYFCSAELIDPIRRKHPDLSMGVGCVRIRDNQEVPLKELVAAFKKAMKLKKTGGPPGSPASPTGA